MMIRLNQLLKYLKETAVVAATLVFLIVCNEGRRPIEINHFGNSNSCPSKSASLSHVVNDNNFSLNQMGDISNASGERLKTGYIFFKFELEPEKETRGKEPEGEADHYTDAYSGIFYFYKDARDGSYKVKIWTSPLFNVSTGTQWQIGFDHNKVTLPIDVDTNSKIYEIIGKLPSSEDKHNVIVNLFQDFGSTNRDLMKQAEKLKVFAEDKQYDPLCVKDANPDPLCLPYDLTQVITATINFKRNGGDETIAKKFLDDHINKRDEFYEKSEIGKAKIGAFEKASLLSAYMEEVNLQEGYFEYFHFSKASKDAIINDLKFTFDANCAKPLTWPEIADQYLGGTSIPVTACLPSHDNKLLSTPINLGTIALSPTTPIVTDDQRYDRALEFMNKVVQATLTEIVMSYVDIYAAVKKDPSVNLYTNAMLFKQDIDGSVPYPKLPNLVEADADMQLLNVGNKIPNYTYPDYYNIRDLKWIDSPDSDKGLVPAKISYNWTTGDKKHFNFTTRPQTGTIMTLNGFLPLLNFLASPEAYKVQGGSVQVSIPATDEFSPIETNDGNSTATKKAVDNPPSSVPQTTTTPGTNGDSIPEKKGC